MGPAIHPASKTGPAREVGRVADRLHSHGIFTFLE